MLECVINVSEGGDLARIDRLADAAGNDLLDVHSDVHHNRTVLTVLGTDAPRRVARVAVDEIDISTHKGVHPRLGAVDVVPFVPLDRATLADAIVARGEFAHWAADELGLPCFLYGPERTLPFVRRHAFEDLLPDVGPPRPHPRGGAVCVGARHMLVAYNLWLRSPATLAIAEAIARDMRGPGVRALGLAVGNDVQVSLNLVDPDSVGPEHAFTAVTRLAEARGATVARAELVGLIERRVLERISPSRWDELGLSMAATVEARLAERLRR